MIQFSRKRCVFPGDDEKKWAFIAAQRLASIAAPSNAWLVVVSETDFEVPPQRYIFQRVRKLNQASIVRGIQVLGFSVLVIFLLFHDVLFSANFALLYRDLSVFDIPTKVEWLESVSKYKELPYWTSRIMGGAPFLAEISLGILHPFNFVFLLFPKDQFLLAHNWFIALQFGVFFAGVYILLKTLHCSHHVSSFIAIIFSCCGVIQSSYNLEHLLLAQTIAPYFLAVWVGYCRNPRITRLVLASALLALPIYGGDPQSIIILGVSALVIHFYYKNKIYHIFFLFGLSLFAAGYQLLPSIQLSAQSIRASNTNANMAWSLHPIRFLEMFFPSLFGNRYPINTYWAGKYINTPSHQPLICALYLGATCNSLLFWAIAYSVQEFAKFKNYIITLSLVLLTLFFLCAGAYSPIPLNQYLGLLVPLWGAFRYPERLIYWLVLVLICSLGQFYQHIYLRHKEISGRTHLLRSLHTSFVIYFLLSLSTLVWLAREQQSVSPVFRGFFLFTLCYVSIFLFLRKKISKTSISILLSLIFIVDLQETKFNTIWAQPSELARPSPLNNEIHADQLLRQKEIRAGAANRYWLTSTPLLIPEDLSKLNAIDQNTRWLWYTMTNNITTVFGIDNVIGSANFTQVYKLDFWHALSSNPERLFDLMSVRYAVSKNKENFAQLTTRQTALPYVFTPQTTVSIKKISDVDLFKKIQTFAYQKETLIEGGPELPPNNPQSNKIEIIKRSGRNFSVSLSTKLSTPVYLVWNETFDPSWHVKVNAIDGKVYRANGWAMATMIPAQIPNSSTLIEFNYENPWIEYGKILSVFWAFLCILVYMSVSLIKPKYRNDYFS